MSSHLRRAHWCAALAAATLISGAAASPAAAKTSLRIATKTATVTVSTSGDFFGGDSRVSTVCRSGERAIAPGIVDASRHLAGQSFGPAAVGAFAVGEPGRVRLRLQTLCAKGAIVSNRRVEARISGGGTSSAPNVLATAKCPGGGTAIGAPLSQEFSPGRGAFSSKPAGKSQWQVLAQGVPSSFPFATAAAAYADVACLSKRSVSAAQTVSQTTGPITAAGAQARVACPSGKRALGWGVELRPFTLARAQPSAGGWSLPYVKQAKLSSSRVDFAFAVPTGGVVSVAATQVAHVVCGKLR